MDIYILYKRPPPHDRRISMTRGLIAKSRMALLRSPIRKVPQPMPEVSVGFVYKTRQ